MDSDSILPFYQNDPNIDLYAWEWKFVDNKVIEVNGEKITAEKIYIATGSRPHIPNIEGLEGTPYFTSTEALKNTQKPKKMIVVWWGYIATELGHFYGAAGVDVHFLVRSEMLKNEDKDIRKEFQKDFESRYNVHFEVTPTKVEYHNNTFSVHLQHADHKTEVIEADALFVATGVVPNSDTLWLEHTDIGVSKRWHIEVDEYLETSVPWVYALGDVVGNYLFRHSVNYEGEYLLAQHYLWDMKTPILYPPMPHAVFSYPQIAWVWVTEDELQKDGKILGKDYITETHNYKNSAMGSAMKSEVWFVKIIANPKTGEILGAHIIGEKASDIIHMLIVCISEKIPVQNLLKNMIFIHPALSEVIRNVLRKLVKKIS